MAARRYWFTLAVFGVLLALSLPMYLTKGASCPVLLGGMDQTCGVGIASPEGILGVSDLARPGWLEVYWALAGVVGGGVAVWWYRRSGYGRRIVPFLSVLVVLGVATTVLTATQWSGFRSASAWAEPAWLLVFNGATPLLVLAPALSALALAERSVGLAVFSLGYCGVGYLFATHDSFYVLHGLGVPLDLTSDPAGIRQLLNIAIPAAVLLLAAAAARLLPLARRRLPAGEPGVRGGAA
ncbi:hypothetical protein [Kitasatospora sp. MAP5-34]|uniref:hypothetical protein n=1 Tax=Kitasatospora sp. MAP5-34 TaxID=3035102 RepID=UPI0024762EED|nr:hypothetical protein [Kitasatospora sp. MAP5-34]MDH6576942.1 hypothetical protein [Kitasatospora sp. MAP5-34]